MNRVSVLSLAALIASAFLSSSVFAGDAIPPASTLTVTVTEQTGGNVQFDFSGTVQTKQGGSEYRTPSGAGNPPTTVSETIGLPKGLRLSNATATTSQPVTGIRFDNDRWYLNLDTGLNFSFFDQLVGSGSVTTNLVPFSNFQAGTFNVIDPNFDIKYVVIGLPTAPVINDAKPSAPVQPVVPAPPAPGAPAPPTPPAPVFVANVDAINSAETGLGFSGANQGILQNLVGGAGGDINDRLFNARSGDGGNTDGGGVALNRASNDTISKYLAFTNAQNIDPRVALGLREGRPVEVVDTLAMQDSIPIRGQFAMLGGMSLSSVPLVTKAVVAMPEGVTDGKNPIGKEVLYTPQPTQWEVFSEADYGYYDQDRLTQAVAGFEVDSYSGTIGLEYDATDWLSVGAAWTHAWSNAELENNLGGIDLEGDLATVYATAFHGNTWLDLFYSYGEFENETSRDTGLGRQAFGDTDSQTHNAGVTLGHNYHLKEGLIAGTSLGLNYAEGGVDAYTERNGGLANLAYGETEFDSLVGRLGASLTCTKEVGFLGMVTSQVRAGWAHEFSPDSSAYSATLVDSPFALLQGGTATSVGGYTASAQNAHPGTDWLELGVGTRFDLNESWNFSLNYEGQFGRNNATAHYGQARVGYEW